MRVQDHLEPSHGFPLSQEPVVVREFLGPDRVINAGGFSLFFVHPDPGQFRVGKRAPWHEGIIRFPGEAQDGAAHHDPTFIPGRVSKLIDPGHVAGPVYMFLNRAQSIDSERERNGWIHLSNFQLTMQVSPAGKV